MGSVSLVIAFVLSKGAKTLIESVGGTVKAKYKFIVNSILWYGLICIVTLILKYNKVFG